MEELPKCESCRSVLAPGAPFCLSCWMPVPEPERPDEPVEPAADATADPAAAGPAIPQVSVPDTVPAEWSAAPVAAPAGHGFFAGPPSPPAGAPAAPDPYAPPASAPLGWRPPLDPNAAPPPPDTGRTINVVVAGFVVLLVGLLGVGGFLGWRSLNKDDTKARAARVFREGDGGPLGDLMVGGSREAALAASPADRAAAAAWLRGVDPAIREFNAAIGRMQEALDRWADGDLAPGAAALAARQFQTDAEKFTEAIDIVNVPPFLEEDVANLVKGAIDYRIAADALLSIIDGRKGFQQLGFGFTAGAANTAWDAGIETVYGAAGSPPAYRPNRG